jgi:hypothetical protein
MKKGWSQWEDLSPEREEEIIEQLAQYFHKRGLGLLALMSLESGGTITSLFAEYWMGIYGPFLDFLEVDEYMALLRRKSSVKKLIKRLEEMDE